MIIIQSIWLSIEEMLSTQQLSGIQSIGQIDLPKIIKNSWNRRQKRNNDTKHVNMNALPQPLGIK